MTPSGKIQKFLLRERAAAEHRKAERGFFLFSDQEQQFVNRCAATRRSAGPNTRVRPWYAVPRERIRELAELGITGLRVPGESRHRSDYVMGGHRAESSRAATTT